MKEYFVLAVVALGLMVLVSEPTFANHGNKDTCRPSRTVKESVEVSDHFVFGTDQAVLGATTLIRDFSNCVANVTITSEALEPNYAYSIWIAVFNRPQFCATPNACVVGDLEIFGGDPRIRASVFWGGGFVADGSGSANTSLVVVPGRTKRELFAETKPHGLRNLRSAEIHVVLRSHGMAGLWGPVAKQIGTAGEACPPSPPGCTNEFASFHPARQSM